jgi:hypothetical protein
MRKNLLLGFATNQSRASVEVFLRSARTAHPHDTTDIGLITNDITSFSDLLAETQAIAFHTPSTYSISTGKLSKILNRGVLHSLRLLRRAGLLRRTPEIARGYLDLIEIWHHPHFARWIAYERILRFYSSQYERAFLSDVKDVAFQSDAFSGHTSNRVQLFQESDTFSTERWNAEWIKKGYGQAALDKVSDIHPVCVGTISGTIPELRDLCSEFVELFSHTPFLTVEQGVFNKLLWDNRFQVSYDLIANFEGTVATLVGEWTNLATELDGQVLKIKSSGRIIPVLHGYDRYPHLREPIVNRFTNSDLTS